METTNDNNLDYYKMISSVTGKPLNELMDTKQHDNYNEKDCKTKELILNNLYDPCTSRQLWNTIRSQGYNAKYKTFTSLLVRYQKAKFIEKSNTKPAEYRLTKFGRENAREPKMLREANIHRYRNFLFEKFVKLINDEPEQFKAIYESVNGVSSINSIVGSGGIINNSSQYSANDYGNVELKDELETKIFDNNFFKDADELKLKQLADGILDNSLTPEQRNELLLCALSEAINAFKGSITLPKISQYKSDKSVGERKYYKTLVDSINQKVTREIYEAIPFRFIYIESKKDLRLEALAVAGKYRNNDDGIILPFDYLNEKIFYNNCFIKAAKVGNEIEFYYVYNNTKHEITTMNNTDYEREIYLNKNNIDHPLNQQKYNMNGKPMGGSPSTEIINNKRDPSQCKTVNEMNRKQVKIVSKNNSY